MRAERDKHGRAVPEVLHFSLRAGFLGHSGPRDITLDHQEELRRESRPSISHELAILYDSKRNPLLRC
jgi:hypothetical protein